MYALTILCVQIVCIYHHLMKEFLISARESELRQLRKQTAELEEQNAILSKHIENMKQAIEKLEVESVQHRSTNMALQGHLETMRSNLTTNFSSVPLPGKYITIVPTWPCKVTWKPCSPISQPTFHLYPY